MTIVLRHSVLLTLLLVCFVLGVSPQSDSSMNSRNRMFLFNTEAPLRIAIDINVALVGFNGKAEDGTGGAYGYKLNESRLVDLLQALLPSQQPTCLNTGKTLAIVYDIKYKVRHLSSADLTSVHRALAADLMYSWSLQKKAKQTTSAHSDDLVVAIENVEEVFHELYARNFPSTSSNIKSDHPYVLFIINPDKRMIDPVIHDDESRPSFNEIESLESLHTASALLSLRHEARLRYSYSYKGSGRSQSWIGSGRFAVLDISAGPVQYGPSSGADGAVSRLTIPRLSQMLTLGFDTDIDRKLDISWASTKSLLRQSTDKRKAVEMDLPVDILLAGKIPVVELTDGIINLKSLSAADSVALSIMEKSSVAFRSRLAAVILSAVRHVFIPDTRVEESQFFERLYVPILVFRNHRRFNPLQGHVKDQQVNSGSASGIKITEYNDDKLSDHVFNINIPEIEREVRKMLLPNQKVFIVPSLEELEDHLHVSMTVARAMRDDTVHELGIGMKYQAKISSYLDSAIIRDEFNKSSHMFDTIGPRLLKGNPELFSFFHPLVSASVADNIEEASRRHRSRLQLSIGTRVFPVYVFSLVNDRTGRDMLVDKTSLYASDSDSVTVLQTDGTDISIPFFQSEGVFVKMSPRSVTRYIVAGLAEALGGIVSPGERYSAPHGRVMHDHLWNVGHHPFGPFASSLEIPQIHLDHVLRNFIISRLDMAQRIVWECVGKLDVFSKKYLYDPMATNTDGLDPDELFPKHNDALSRSLGWFESLLGAGEHQSPFPIESLQHLSESLDWLQNQFSKVSEHLTAFQLQHAYELSAHIVERARAFEAYSDGELVIADQAMACCDISHSVNKEFPWKLSGIFVLLALCVYVLVYAAVIPENSSIRSFGGGFFGFFARKQSDFSIARRAYSAKFN